jgi:hypothetical protein
MTEKIYLGRDNGAAVVVLEGEHTRPLKHIPYHSQGFSWGYNGSGPADLALAILADHFEEDPDAVLAAVRSMWAPRSKAAKLYQDFKTAFVANAPPNVFRVSSPAIDVWLELPRQAQALADLALEDAELTERGTVEEAP